MQKILFYNDPLQTQGGIIMRGVETRIQEIRHKIFTEVARMAYHTEWPVKERMEELPYKIIPGETGNFRNDVFLERAIVGERLRLAMGLPNRSAAEHAPVSDGIEAADQAETYYTPPLINVIKFACNACPTKRVHVTDGCQGCLAHPCMEVCPKGAVSLDRTTGRSIIDQEKCIKCGRCASVCSYNAIIIQERPCAKACGMDAITSDENGKANIDYDKCVSCGQCLVNCPFGAIADKSQIFQTIRAIQSGEKVYAAVAPAFVGQFGPKVTPGKLRAAMKELGFADVFEVAIGADLCAKQEAEDFLKEVPDELPFMATSCCPAWVNFFEHHFPDMLDIPSTARSPQQMFGSIAKSYWAEKMGIPREKLVVVSIMPCLAKKYECARDEFKVNGIPDVDYSISTRELARLIKRANIGFPLVLDSPFDNPMGESTGAGVIFGTTGGVMEAALRSVYEIYTGETLKNVNFEQVRGLNGVRRATINLNGFELKVGIAHGLGNARHLLEDIRNGHNEYHVIEIMACPGGCIGGGGQPLHHGNSEILYARANALYREDANKPLRKSHENPYIKTLYEDYLGKPLGEKSETLLHTHYFNKAID